jgi:NADPH2:quinone reductase
VAAGRDPAGLERLAAAEAVTVVDLVASREEVVHRLAANGPYDLVADYLWSTPAEMAFDALQRCGASAGSLRYILVGMAAGDDARLPAMALRRVPLRVLGSGTARPLELDDAAVGFADMLRQVAVGDLGPDIDAVPLSDVEAAWNRSDSRRRIVLVPDQ